MCFQKDSGVKNLFHIFHCRLLLTIHATGVENEGTLQDVGGRKIDQRPVVQQQDSKPAEKEVST